MKLDGSDKNREPGTGEKKPKTIKQQILEMTKSFEMALPKTITPERMMRIVMTALQKSNHLAECEPRSFFGALLTALQLGLEPNTPLGHCYLIPRYNKKQQMYICSFEMGYQGMLELAYRTKMYHRISARVVYQGDKFSFEYGTNHHLNHVSTWQTDEPIFVYADYVLDNGGYDFSVWSWKAILRHAEEFSESFDSDFSPWKSSKTSMEEMAKKTVAKALLKYGPKSVEIASDMVQALNSDGNAVFVQKNEEGNGLQFDVQYPEIEAPNDDLKVPGQQAPAAEKAAKDAAAQGEEEGELVVVKPAAKPQTASALFNQDEDEALEEQYQRQSGVQPPDFG